MTHPIVTLGMPIYNVASYVKASLLSALNQTFDSLEIIIVDDKGQDNSMEIVHSIISSHPRGNIVRIIEHAQNLKTGAAKNSIINNAKGKYVFFMDSDDIITPECIQIFYDRISSSKAEVAYGSQGKYEERNTNKPIKNFKAPDNNIKGEFALLKYITQNKDSIYPVGITNKMFDLSFLNKYNIRCIPSHLQEDVWFTFQIMRYTTSFVSISIETYKQIIHSSSQSYTPLGAFHKKQNHEIYEKEKELMKSFNYVPKGLLDYYCFRLKYLIPSIRSSSNYTEQEKKEMTLDYTNIDGIKFKLTDICRIDTFLLVFAYKSHSYFIIKHLHTLLNKIKAL